MAYILSFQRVFHLFIEPHLKFRGHCCVLRRHIPPLARILGATHRIFNRTNNTQPDTAVDFVAQGDVVFVTSNLRYCQGDIHFARPGDIVGLDSAVRFVGIHHGDAVVVQGVKVPPAAE